MWLKRFVRHQITSGAFPINPLHPVILSKSPFSGLTLTNKAGTEIKVTNYGAIPTSNRAAFGSSANPGREMQRFGYRRIRDLSRISAPKFHFKSRIRV
jgi:hypothetical protein